jgi:predicted amidohydrolase
MPNRSLRVALVQAAPIPGDVVANAAAAAKTILAERDARLVVFPELFLSSYDLALLAANADAWIAPRDPRLEPVRRACAETGATAVLGGALRAGDDRFIVAPVIGPGGDVGISYKEHIHGSERGHFRAGDACAPFEVDGWRVAIGICFDAAHPAHAERAAARGADLYAVSALYGIGEERRVDLHLGARAMDNRVFSVLANYAGKTGPYTSLGGSGAWTPTGNVQARVPHAEAAVLAVELDAAEVTRFRA